jgi:hypothetical protein
VAAEIEPPELARLVELSERPRARNWSMRAALTRYAQPEPRRVGDVLELVRRAELAIRSHLKVLERDGVAVWDSLEASGAGADGGADEPVVGLLRAMVELDRLGDVLAGWAADPAAAERPDASVDAAVAEVGRRLDALGIPREQRQRPTRQRPRS